MLEAIIDTNIIVNAIFNQQENEDCWEILRLLHVHEFKPVVSKQLLKEYNYVLNKIVILSLAERFKEIGYDEVILKEALESTYDLSSEISLVFEASRIVQVISKSKICICDSEDDKIVNLAIDGNCQYIVTKNMSDLNVVNEKKVKTKNGTVIQVVSPEIFCNLVKLDKWSQKSKA